MRGSKNRTEQVCSLAAPTCILVPELQLAAQQPFILHQHVVELCKFYYHLCVSSVLLSLNVADSDPRGCWPRPVHNLYSDARKQPSVNFNLFYNNYIAHAHVCENPISSFVRSTSIPVILVSHNSYHIHTFLCNNYNARLRIYFSASAL